MAGGGGGLGGGRVANLKKILIFRKISGVNSVFGEKLHDFAPRPTPLRTGMSLLLSFLVESDLRK